MIRIVFVLGLACLMQTAAIGEALQTKGLPALEVIQDSRWSFGGELGLRIDRDVENWLLRMPAANPGLLEMFSRRDRRVPFNEQVPWAGEFAGKYLISAVQACRMSEDPRLRPFTQAFVDQLVARQAENGYLGPWPHAQQLRGQWDLWGHYHCMLGLLMWYDDTGDQKAYDCVVRAADCICRLYVDEGRRPIEAGSPPMNLSVIYIMAEMYRRTGDPRYLTLIQRIEEDMPKDGDWLNKGAEGVPYYKLPGMGPRWESLHIVQGFAVLYEITGEERYKKALLSLWDSIRDFDRHPSGAFSSNEGASGNIFSAGSIETCCSVAWMALCIDALRLTGDPTAADEIELTLWNQALGAQHPSGNWCTYDTPLNGLRAPSYHQINFQYRPGTPELNCCSVNGPRTLGMLSEWAVMRDAAGLLVNFYGPSDSSITLRDGAAVHILQTTGYPVEGHVRIDVNPEKETQFELRLRIPAWSAKTAVLLNGKAVDVAVTPGTYVALDRTWKSGDAVELAFDMRPRCLAGQGPDRGGRGAIHVGPLLLAFDAYYNEVETPDLKPINAAALKIERIPVPPAPDAMHFSPMGMWRAQTDDGTTIQLCDFASAGANGTDYASWLPVSHLAPIACTLKYPAHEDVGMPSPALFQWTTTGESDVRYDLAIARDATFQNLVVDLKDLKESRVTVSDGIGEEGTYFWKVTARNAYGATENAEGPRSFRVARDGSAPFLSLRDDMLLMASPLDGAGKPSYGVCELEEGLTPGTDRLGNATGAVAFGGPGSKLRYSLPFFPERDYAFMAWVCPEGLPSSGQQVFSAWCRGMDDPLRVMLNGNEISARIEGGGSWGTPGVPVENGKWYHVAAVKEGTNLSLFIDGKKRQSTTVPEIVRSQSTLVGVGFNPLFGGGEHFVGCIDDCAFYARALRAEEIEKAAAGSH